MPKTRKKIQLPALPKSWSHLSTEELEEVNRLMRCKQQAQQTTDPCIADRRFKLQCFLYLTGMKLLKRTVVDDKDEIVYLLRRKGISHLLEYIPMRSWQISQWIDSGLSFLDNPQKRTMSPYQFVWVREKKFKAPADLLTDLTYQQYSSAQTLLSGYWNTIKLIDTLIEQNALRVAIREQLKKIYEYQCKFLAALFTPWYIEKETVKEGKTIKVHHRVWIYDQSQIKENAWRFRKVSSRMFPVMLQFFQSVQLYFSYIFPDLFTTDKGAGSKDMLTIEVEMVNAVMKYQGFKDYKEVYESDSVRCYKSQADAARWSCNKRIFK